MGGQVDLAPILAAVEKSRTELGREIGEVKRCVGRTREDMAGLRQLVADHVGSPALHPELPERPCADLTRHKERHWSITVLAVGSLITAALAVVGVVLLALVKAGVLG